MRRDISIELQRSAPARHGTGAWDELSTQEGKPSDVGLQSSRWLIENLLHKPNTCNAWRHQVRHQMKAAKFRCTVT